MDNTELLDFLKAGQFKPCVFCLEANHGRKYTLFCHDGQLKVKAHSYCIDKFKSLKLASLEVERLIPKVCLFESRVERFKKIEQSIASQPQSSLAAGTPSYDREANIQPAVKAGDTDSSSLGGCNNLAAQATFNLKKKQQQEGKT